MGFFSWKTADTEESIPNVHSGLHKGPVYLLQPNDQKPIEEAGYDGYGVFGGVDAYVWLIETNAKALGLDLRRMSAEQRRSLGISLEVGDVCRDTQTGEIWHVFSDARKLVPGKFFKGTYAEVIPEYGACANDLMDSGRFERVDICDLLEFKPLKFSFDPSAVYEDYPASQNCPHQGFFYPEEVEEGFE